MVTNTESQDCFKVSLSVIGGSLNLYELHQQVARFANSAVSVTLTPVPEAPTSPHPDQLELGEGDEAEPELVMCPDCSGGRADMQGQECPTCHGKREIPVTRLAETTFRLLRCEGCGAQFSTRDAEDAQPGRACPICEKATVTFVEPPVEEPAAEECRGEGEEAAEAGGEEPAGE